MRTIFGVIFGVIFGIIFGVEKKQRNIYSELAKNSEYVI